MMRASVIALVLLLASSGAELVAQRAGGASAVDLGSDLSSSHQVPEKLREVGFDQRLGDSVPLDLRFEDETGRTVELGDFFGERPVALSLVYYDCPMLCPMTLNGLSSSLKALTFEIGEDFDVVVVSFDPDETSDLAAEAKRHAVARYGRAGSERGWHFLTGDPAAIDQLTEAVGFRYRRVDDSEEYAHAAGLVALTPQGQIARYFFGIEYPPKDLRLGLVEASEGKIGSVVDQILLYCFQYDADIGRYSAVTLNILRLAGVATVLALASFVSLMLWQEKKKNRMKPRTA